MVLVVEGEVEAEAEAEAATGDARRARHPGGEEGGEVRAIRATVAIAGAGAGVDEVMGGGDGGRRRRQGLEGKGSRNLVAI